MYKHKLSKKQDQNIERKAKNERKRLNLDTLKRSSQSLILTALFSQIYLKSLNKQLIILNSKNWG